MTDYKKYALEQLENWLHDAMDNESTADEIYELIQKVVLENYEYHSRYAAKCERLLELLNNNQSSNTPTKNKVKKWILPIEVDDDFVYYIHLPHDLLQAANLDEGDQIEWIDNGDGSFKMVKVDATH